MPTIYSTITNSSTYVMYEKLENRQGGNDMPREIRRFTVQGGAGVAAKRTFVTALGIATPVTKDDLDWLEADVNFQRHVKAGYLTVIKGNSKPDVDKVVADMAQRDGASPLVPNDFPEAKVPTSGDEKPVSPLTTAPRVKKIGAASAFR